MNEAEEQINPRFEPIPEEFYPFLENKPFSKCLCCETKLLDGKSSYVIQKSYAGKEVVFEYAICETCYNQLSSEISNESLEAVQKFIHHRIEFGRGVQLLKEGGQGCHAWTESCILCHKKKDDKSKHTELAFCHGKNIILCDLPVMICESCEFEYQKQLSKKTRERLDDFIGSNFDCPPAHEDLHPTRTTVLI